MLYAVRVQIEIWKISNYNAENYNNTVKNRKVIELDTTLEFNTLDFFFDVGR